MAAENPDPKTGEVNLFAPEFLACPQAVFRTLRSQFPVARSAFTQSPVISRYEDVVWALRHPQIFSSEMDMQLALGTERPMIPQQIDPPAQTRYRKILDPCFSRRRMAKIEPHVRRHANALIDKIVDLGECEFDEAFAVPLPCTAFLSLLGLPHDHLEHFLELKDGIIRPDTTDPDEAARIRANTGRQIYAYFEDVIEKRRSNPGDDTLSYLVKAEIDGKRLERNEILDICFLLIIAGLDTVTATLGCSIAYLAANPEQRERLVRNPAQIPGAVEELLRWETPVMAVPRVAKSDITMRDVQIKKGDLVTLLAGHPAARRLQHRWRDIHRRGDGGLRPGAQSAHRLRRGPPPLPGIASGPIGAPGGPGRVAPARAGVFHQARGGPHLLDRHSGGEVPAPRLAARARCQRVKIEEA